MEEGAWSFNRSGGKRKAPSEIASSQNDQNTSTSSQVPVVGGRGGGLGTSEPPCKGEGEEEDLVVVAAKRCEWTASEEGPVEPGGQVDVEGGVVAGEAAPLHHAPAPERQQTLRLALQTPLQIIAAGKERNQTLSLPHQAPIYKVNYSKTSWAKRRHQLIDDVSTIPVALQCDIQVDDT